MVKRIELCERISLAYFNSCYLHAMLYEAKGYNHGYLSAYLPYEDWFAVIFKEWFIRNV